MKKYKNILFDMGNVLIDFSPYSITSAFTQDVDSINRLTIEIFFKQEWLDLDQGLIDEDKAYQSIIQRLPTHDHMICKEILQQWHITKTDQLDMLQVVKELKEKGYRLFLCSNASLRFHLYKDSIESFRYFDDLLISADIQVSKPNPEFFNYILKKHALDPKECFFIDDLSHNILGANRLGIDGYLFNGNTGLLKEYLRIINIL
ncbi:MAG: HAD family phosphatase [Erysipelothrix sp.]|nr:HAD family phosphatase [Erysipelothrix sp.]